MIHWIWLAVFIETVALLSRVVGAATGRMKLALLFGFNVMPPVVLFLRPASSGKGSSESAR